MHRRLIPLAYLAFLISTSLPSAAEPGRVATWLMNEPMSLFDWGVYKTDKKMADLKTIKETYSAQFFFGSADYDWNANRLQLRVSFIGKETEAECIENIKRAKGAFLNYTWSEREQAKIAKEVFAALFSHEGGYKSKGQPEDIGEQVASMSVIEATAFIQGDKGSFLPKARCRMDFKSPEVSVIKQ
jgi:hypothetical protein